MRDFRRPSIERQTFGFRAVASESTLGTSFEALHEPLASLGGENGASFRVFGLGQLDASSIA